MSDTYTIVTTDDSEHAAGYACNGRVTREEVIAEARRFHVIQRAQSEKFLQTKDADLIVRVVRGWHRQKTLEVLNP